MRRLFQTAVLTVLTALLLLPVSVPAACCQPGPVRCLPHSSSALRCAAASFGCCRQESARAVVADLQTDAVPPVFAPARDMRPSPFFAVFHAPPASADFRSLQPLLCTFLI
jgi:hypothetical protein